MQPNSAFKEVRNILQKLDRSIDEARARRLNIAPERETPDLNQEQDPLADVASETAQETSTHGFGKAKPIRRNDEESRFKGL